MTRLLAVLVTLLALTVGAPAAGAAVSGPLTWGPSQHVDPTQGGFAGISCLSATFCRAGDRHGHELGYDGADWTQVATLADTTTSISSTSCTSTTFCVAVGRDSVYLFDGNRWTERDHKVGSSNRQVSCVSRTFCILVSQFAVQRWDGAHWSSRLRIDQQPLIAVSCAAVTMCRALDRFGDILRWNGRSWSAPETHDSHQLVAIDCQTTTFCVAADEDGGVVRFDGAHWSARRQVGADGRTPTAVDCSSPAFCVVVDGNGNAVEYVNGSWRTPVAIDAGATLRDVSCPTAAFCAATADGGDAVLRFDGSWHEAQSVSPWTGGGITAISCADRDLCVLTDVSGHVLEYDGTVWSAPQLLVQDQGAIDVNVTGPGLADVSCVSASFCMAVSGTGDAYVLVDGEWSSPIDIGLGRVSAVSCTSADHCLVTPIIADELSQVAIWDGSTFTITSSSPFAGFTALSCATASFCMALQLPDQAEEFIHTYPVRDVDGTWTYSAYPGQDSESVISVSCTAPTSCLGLRQVDAAGTVSPTTAMRYNGSTWQALLSQAGHLGFGISCADAQFCVSVGLSAESTWNGTTWTAPQTIAGARTLRKVSCRDDICVAVGTEGAAVAT